MFDGQMYEDIYAFFWVMQSAKFIKSGTEP